MKSLEVKKLESITYDSPLESVSLEMDTLGDGNVLDVVNWSDYPYKPQVKFNIAYNKDVIFLKFYVDEKYILAEKENSNDPVCQDSCVEMFVSPGLDGVYYNIEISCIGTILIGKGTGRADSKVIDAKYIDMIKRYSTLGDKTFEEKSGDFYWELTAAIPKEVFFDHKITSLEGANMKANFQKCGDNVTEPHFITWNPIETKEPDYHRPEYFGNLSFK